MLNDRYKACFERNIGLFSLEEQEKIQNSRIAIAGLGGVGGLAAERLMRLGVGSLRITDPGRFEASNINRQFGATVDNLGQYKAEIVYGQIKDINPLARIEYDKQGITRGGMSSFLQDCQVVIDAMDFGMFEESILLQKTAKQMGIFYLFTAAIGFGAISVVFGPGGMTLEEYDRVPSESSRSQGVKISVPIDRILPIVPEYVHDRKLLADIIAGRIPVPTSSIGAGLAAIQAASEAINIIIGRDIPLAPSYTYNDLVDRRLVVGTMS
jgi:molybdopterin/thiamine biosynthesis adenylyltransferase